MQLIRPVRMLIAACAALVAAMFAFSAQANAFSQNYCYTTVNVGYACDHGNYNSIIYNRGTTVYHAGNDCVFMITAAGNLRGNGAVPCDTDFNYDARECVSGDTPMSKGVTYPTSYQDYIAGVVNNLTYDSGCAV